MLIVQQVDKYPVYDDYPILEKNEIQYLNLCFKNIFKKKRCI